MEIEKVEYKEAYENVMVAYNMLKEENEKLKKKIETAIHIVYECTFLDIHRRELLNLLEGDINEISKR